MEKLFWSLLISLLLPFVSTTPPFSSIFIWLVLKLLSCPIAMSVSLTSHFMGYNPQDSPGITTHPQTTRLVPLEKNGILRGWTPLPHIHAELFLLPKLCPPRVQSP